MTHIVRYPAYSTESQFYEKYEKCLKLCVGVCCVVYLFSCSLNHGERERMAVHVRIVPFVGVCQWFGLSIGDVLVLVSKRFVWRVVFVWVCVICVCVGGLYME